MSVFIGQHPPGKKSAATVHRHGVVSRASYSIGHPASPKSSGAGVENQNTESWSSVHHGYAGKTR